MKKTSYLYGIEPNDLIGMNYINAIQYKRDKGTQLFKKLYFMHNRTEEEEERLFHVRKAVEHTRKLIEEIE